MSINYNKVEEQARKLHANAKNGTVTIDGMRYTLEFDRYTGVYQVTDENGNDIVRFNTRKVTQARTWLREYLDS